MKLLVIISLLVGIYSNSCVSKLNATKAEGRCSNAWSDLKPYLKPSQRSVGFAWVQRKVSKDFSSKKKAQNEMDDTLVPGAIGPDGFIYIADSHHTLCALDFSGYSETIVSMDIICDYRHMSMTEFFNALTSQNLMFLGHASDATQLPTKISPSELPQQFSFTHDLQVFTDDPWRAMASYSRKVEDVPGTPSCDYKYCMRCFFRGCADGWQETGAGVAFFEFRWAYFMRDAMYHNVDLWPSSVNREVFTEKYDALGSATMGQVDVDAWLNVARYVISLCRFNQTSQYVLPETLFPVVESGKVNILPGLYEGYIKMENKDPSCDSPSCKH